jgi:two-component SAPR family response regulator
MNRRPSTSPAAQRKAAERARKREQGLIQLEYWVLPEQRQRLDKFVDRLRREAEMLA